jgi:hypothetical protein
MSIRRSTELFSIILSSKFSEAVHEKFIVSLKDMMLSEEVFFIYVFLFKYKILATAFSLLVFLKNMSSKL